MYMYMYMYKTGRLSHNYLRRFTFKIHLKFHFTLYCPPNDKPLLLYDNQHFPKSEGHLSNIHVHVHVLYM